MAKLEKDKSVGGKRVQKSYFDVLGLCCSSEVPLIENILKPLDGVNEVTVIIATRTVIVLHDTLLISHLQIAKALNEARLEANIRVLGEDNFKKKWPSPYSVACGVLLSLSFIKYAYSPFRWLALGAVAIGILPICLKAVASIRNLRLDINILAIVAVIGTVAMGDYLEAGTIVFLFTIAEWLESRASHKANAVMTSLMSMVPQQAVIAETGEVVDADEVKLNTVLAVKAGEVIPIDGLVVDGNCEVDEKTLTGESFPVAKHKDSIVWAGTINLNGYISVKTTALAEDCAVAKMTMLVEEAQNSKSKTQTIIEQCATFYTPAVILISILVAVIPAAIRLDNMRKWFHLALVILVSACPCALILSTPVAAFCALTKAAKSGLLVKGSEYLEILSKIKILAFDKTGTITKGEFTVTDFQPLRDDVSFEALVYWVSSIESKSSHPMAAALVEYGQSLSIEPKPENVEDFQNFPGEGIYGRIDGNDIFVGNKKISARASSEIVPTLEGYNNGGKSLGYVYRGGTPVGIFAISDNCRIGVAEAIKEIKLLGIKTAMLTGDSHASAMYTQQQVGNAIEVIHAELLPEEKAKLVAEFKKGGPTAMVGDGINDAPALATADVGISMGISGSALATETGHMILMSNDIRKIPKAIKLSRRATRKVVQNIVISIGTKIAILTLAIAGHPLVWAAVLADVGTCLLVIANSMLLLKDSDSKSHKCCKSKCEDKPSHEARNNHHHDHSEKCGHSTSSSKPPSSSHSCGTKCHDSDAKKGSLCVHEAKTCHHNDHNDHSKKCGHSISPSNCEAKSLSSGSSCRTKCHKSDASRKELSYEARKPHHHDHHCHSSRKLASSSVHCGSSHCGENHPKNEDSNKMIEPSFEPKHQDCTTIDIITVPPSEEPTATIACVGVSLEKRETIGDCCSCSTNHGHLKGLSEVVIEH